MAVYRAVNQRQRKKLSSPLQRSLCQVSNCCDFLNLKRLQRTHFIAYLPLYFLYRFHYKNYFTKKCYFVFVGLSDCYQFRSKPSSKDHKYTTIKIKKWNTTYQNMSLRHINLFSKMAAGKQLYSMKSKIFLKNCEQLQIKAQINQTKLSSLVVVVLSINISMSIVSLCILMPPYFSCYQSALYT